MDLLSRVITLLIAISVITGCSYLVNKPKMKPFCHHEPAIDIKLSSCANNFYSKEFTVNRDFLFQTIDKIVERVDNTLETPKKDGKKYYGEILMCLNRVGQVDSAVL